MANSTSRTRTLDAYLSSLKRDARASESLLAWTFGPFNYPGYFHSCKEERNASQRFLNMIPFNRP